MDINKLYMWVSLLLRYGVEENAEASSSMSKAYFPPSFLNFPPAMHCVTCSSFT